MKKFKFLSAVLGFTLCAAVAAVAETTVKIGDVAPKLETGKWVQGEPVKGFDKGTAYIVEFWATWCGPCKVSIPHLNEIAQKYKDKGLTVIGQDCWEKDDDLVAPFVKKMADKMTYRVALDNKADGGKGAMAIAWMEAAGMNGIPSAFLIDKTGHIAWIGHPMELTDTTIDEVLAGTFDVKKAAEAAAKKNAAQSELQSLSMEYGKAMKGKDWEAANATLDKIEKVLPAEAKGSILSARFGIFVAKKDFAGAYKYALQVSDSHLDNAMIQNEFAWRILVDPSLEERDLKVAETIAQRAEKASKGKDAGILDTLARAEFMLGKKKEAIELSTKALSLAEGEAKESYTKTLESYKADKLPSAQ